VENNLIRGLGNGHFAPNKVLTRAEAATLLDRLQDNSIVVTGDQPQTDTTEAGTSTETTTDAATDTTATGDASTPTTGTETTTGTTSETTTPQTP
jgi:hypothetical protein